MTFIASTEKSSSFTVADYLVKRLNELGIEHLFNVPGSYCGGLLQALQNSKSVRPILTTYELEAVYAADGYARINGFGAFCQTYGVGALSSLNGVAGAFVERCPIIAITGGPSAQQLQNEIDYGILFLHSTGRLKTDSSIYQQVTVAAEIIQTAAQAPRQIDAALIACMTYRRPVYLEISENLWDQPCSTPDAPLHAPPQAVDERALSECLDETVLRLCNARFPLVWGGEEIDRWGLQDNFASLVARSGLRFVTTLPGKAIVAETTSGFVGVYDGRFARRDTQAVVSQADLVLALGTAITDFIGDVVARDYQLMVLAAGGGVRVGFHTYNNIPLSDFIRGLTKRVEEVTYTPPYLKSNNTTDQSCQDETEGAPGEVEPGKKIARSESPNSPIRMTFDLFFDRIEAFIEGKLAIADTSLALFASADIKVRSQSSFISQAIWMSIGYSLGASLGVALASAKRPVVFVGDAGFREGPQALSTLVQYKLPVVVCVMSNRFLGIQQFLTGPGFYTDHEPADYFNLIPGWDYAALAKAFDCHFSKVTTLQELDEALEKAEQAVSQPYLVEVVLDPKDLPSSVADALPRLVPSEIRKDFEFPLLSRQTGPATG